MWSEQQGKLAADFEFKDFPSALSFMVRAGYIVESMGHHPEWTNVYNKLHIELTTHEAGNQVTEKDRKLADALLKLYQSS